MPESESSGELPRHIQLQLDAGQTGAARDLLVRYCDTNRSDVVALRTLAGLHEQFSEPAAAVECLRVALTVTPVDAELHMQMAGLLARMGMLADAASHCRTALQYDPGQPDWWWTLGDLSARLEDFPTVEQCCRMVLSCNPELTLARLYLGVSLQRQGRLEEAREELLVVVAVEPAIPEAWFYLGLVSQSLNDSESALAQLQRALDLGMDPVQPLFNMALIHQQSDRLRDALDCSFNALQCNPGVLKYRQLFVRVLRALSPEQISLEMRRELLRCFDLPGIDSFSLMKSGMMLVSQELQMQRLVGLALQDDYDAAARSIASGAVDALLQDPLLNALLLHTVIASTAFESVLRLLRRYALEQVLHPDSIPGSVIFRDHAAVAVALACQFFSTEYAADVEAQETTQLRRLTDQLCAGKQGIPDTNRLLAAMCVSCMYQPLSQMPEVRQLVERRSLSAHGPFARLWRTQWLEFLAEQEDQQQLDILNSAQDSTSRAVKQQYEQSPYPRWETVTWFQPVPLNELFTSLCPGCVAPEVTTGRPDVLIAGCGTGRHAIMSASLYGNASVLAIDLSANSLRYAMRKARELDIRNLQFAQADILELSTIGRTFHIIESVGVLHHMQNPEDGLRILTGLLPPNGLIKLGLYSKAGRRDVAAARDLLAANGLQATPDGIRRGRRAIMALPADRLERQVTRFRDFYTLSECRDLLFHVQEIRFDLQEVAELLQRCGLRFHSFEMENHAIRTEYLRRNPHDPEMQDLAAWHQLEQEMPDTFSDMYQFWCQKI